MFKWAEAADKKKLLWKLFAQTDKFKGRKNKQSIGNNTLDATTESD
jgi:hypothetical protein